MARSLVAWIAGLVVLIFGVAGVSALIGSSNQTTPVSQIPVMTPAPTTTPVVELGPCPVDPAICEFAKQAEFEFREGDPAKLLSPKSEYYPEMGVLRAGMMAMQDKPLEPRVIGIGCSVDPGGGVCGRAFSLVFTASPADQQEELIDRVLLGFLRDGDELPIVTTNRLVGGSFNPLTSGQESADCGLSGLTDGSECLGTRFYGYVTGPAVARAHVEAAPTPGIADPLTGIDIARMHPGMQASIGYDSVVYYSTGCYACGRPQIPNLFRTYRDASGQLRTDDLFGPLLAKSGGYPKSVAADWEHGHLLVQVCATGYCGGEGDPSADATIRLFRSRDGGVTFQEEPAEGFPVNAYLNGFQGDRPIVIESIQRGLDYSEQYYLFPSHQPLSPPPGIGRATPFPYGEGRIGWLNHNPTTGFYTGDGRLLIPSPPGRRLVYVAPLPVGHLAYWASEDGNGATIGVYHGTWELAGALQAQGFIDLRGNQLPGGLLVGNVDLGVPFGFGVDGGGDACKASAPVYPSLVNWNTGEVFPIHELGDCDGGRHKFVNYILARTVVRVSTGGDCLNVRTAPSTSADSLGCFADGVLLGVRGDGPPPVIAGWLAVVTPALEPGWVAEEFVER